MEQGEAREACVAIALKAAKAIGIRFASVDVVSVGRGPTPMLYYAAATLGVDGGIMITGSHNPPDYNGFKLVMQGKPFYGAAIQRLGRVAAELGAPKAARGTVTTQAILDEYVARIVRDYDGARGLTVDGVDHPALEIDVVDTTGAGDALAAGFLVGGPSLGLEAAARCCRQVGAMP